MVKPGRTKTWIGLMFLNGQGCVGVNLEFFSASSGVGLRIHSLVSETRLGQVCSQPDHVLKILPNLMGSHTIVTKIVMQNVPNDMLVLCFSVKPPRRTLLKINSEMTWLSFSFHYKRLNLYFTIKLVFEIRTSHYIHALAFSCKTHNLAGDPAPGCTSLFTAHWTCWSRLAKWSNTNKYTHCEGSHLKHKCSCIHFDENFIIVWVFLMRIPRLLEGFLDINHAVFVCVRIRNSIVTSCSIKLSAVLLIACHFCHEVHNLPLAPKAKGHGSCLWMYGKKSCYPCYPRWSRSQIRVSVTVQVWLMPVNNIPWKSSKTPMLFLMEALTN